MSTEKTAYWIIGITAVTMVGLLVIPPLMKKYGNKLYKASLKKDDIDFENLGPEIIKKEDLEEKK